MKIRQLAMPLLIGFLMISPLAATAQEAPTAPTPAPAVHKTSLFHMIKQGGWAMWFLGACSFGMITTAALNFQRINRNKMMPASLISELIEAAKQGDLEKLRQTAEARSVDSFFARTLAAGLKYVNPADPAGCKPKVEAAIGEAIGREDVRYSYFVNFLSLLTSMSPMWGLVGTVSGMIGAFSKIGTGAMGKPELLAANIGEALVCTATGLFIAIFSMFFYFLFRNNLNALMKEAEAHLTEILDHLLGVGTEEESTGES